jgi:hypothetical protein
MCDGWPAGPAPSRFYSTRIGTDPDPYCTRLVPASPSGYTTTLAAPPAKGRGRLIRCTAPIRAPTWLSMPSIPYRPPALRP